MNAPLPEDIRVGAVLGGTYEVTSVIGEGGMGYVLAARHLRLPKQVAVKVLKTGMALSPDIVARFRREAEIASRLGHPNIVEVLDFDTLPSGTPFLVLEFLKGESLGQRLARGPLSWEETRDIALQVGSALLAAHRAGVVHRDLKPDNIFLLPGDSAGTTRHRVKLLDFGISKLTASGTLQTQDAVLMGTPQYMSPEQALGNNSAIDARSDVFALGCIYYEMLAGRPAFSGGNLPTIVYRIVHEPPRPLPEWVPSLPPHAWPALQHALAKAVDERTPDVATLTEELTGTRLREQADAPVLRLGSGATGFEDTHVPASTPMPHRRAQPSSSGGTPALEATFIPGQAAVADTHVPRGAAPRGNAAAGEAREAYGPGVAPPLDETVVPGAAPGGPQPARPPTAATPPLDATFVPGSTPMVTPGVRVGVPAGSASGIAAVPASRSLDPAGVPAAAPVLAPVNAAGSPTLPAPPVFAAPVMGGPASGRRGAGLAIAGGVALVLGAGLFFASKGQPTPPVAGAPPVIAAPSVPTAPAAVVAPVPPLPPEVPTPAPAELPPPAVQRPLRPEQRAPREPAAAKAPELPLAPTDARALAELELAEKALAANNAEEALHHARRSLQAEPSGRASSLLTRAHCSQHDLSNAQAQFQGVPRALRAACKQWCATFDIDLGSK